MIEGGLYDELHRDISDLTRLCNARDKRIAESEDRASALSDRSLRLERQVADEQCARLGRDKRIAELEAEIEGRRESERAMGVLLREEIDRNEELEAALVEAVRIAGGTRCACRPSHSGCQCRAASITRMISERGLTRKKAIGG